jgi:hypothetical protein
MQAIDFNNIIQFIIFENLHLQQRIKGLACILKKVFHIVIHKLDAFSHRPLSPAQFHRLKYRVCTQFFLPLAGQFGLYYSHPSLL